MKHLLVIVLFYSFTTSFAQERYPAFMTKKDSAVYSSLTTQIDSLYQLLYQPTQPNAKSFFVTIDSLKNAINNIRTSRQAGWHYVYHANKSFTAWSPLLAHIRNLDSVKTLTIENLTAKKLPKELLKCTQLQRLELVNTHINKIQKLKALVHLHTIDIYNNTPKRRLKLKRNTHVKVLRIHGDYPKKLPKQYRSFQHLDTLDLARNRLTSFPNISRNHIHTLGLSDNELTLNNLPAQKNESLKILVLTNNKITKVPDRISNFRHLQKLNLQQNSITQLSDRLAQLTALENISLYKNALTSIPTVLFRLPNLQIVDLYYNHIKEIPNRVAQWKNMQLLYLAHNEINKVSDSLASLVNLRELYLHHNTIAALPSLAKLKLLHVLRINSNLLAGFPEGTFELAELENLDVSHNTINQLPAAITQLPHLHLLDIVDNPWQDIENVYSLAEQLTKRGVTVHTGITRTIVTDE